MRFTRVISICAALLLGAASIAHTPATSGTIPIVTVDDGRIDLSAYRGRVVYLDFWASWCAPCQESFPWMNAMMERYGPDGLVIVAVNVDSDREQAIDFVGRMKPTFDVAWDEDKSLAAAYDLEGMPSSFVFDRDGTLRMEHVGFRDRDRTELEDAIRELLVAGTAGGAP